ncbi:hypothetical protein BDR26DRAFT_419438 [Obelidium mucronatum]|nr:hypothetical protein BDR26DRAFT_419438 [Obelidium mucronatum]
MAVSANNAPAYVAPVAPTVAPTAAYTPVPAGNTPTTVAVPAVPTCTGTPTPAAKTTTATPAGNTPAAYVAPTPPAGNVPTTCCRPSSPNLLWKPSQRHPILYSKGQLHPSWKHPSCLCCPNPTSWNLPHPLLQRPAPLQLETPQLLTLRQPHQPVTTHTLHLELPQP